jgi:hypothetical protein
MNEDLQKKLSSLEQLIAIQEDSVIAGSNSVQYMHGMLNGLICAHSIFANQEPVYLSRAIKRRNGNIRHKNKIKAGRIK